MRRGANIIAVCIYATRRSVYAKRAENPQNIPRGCRVLATVMADYAYGASVRDWRRYTLFRANAAAIWRWCALTIWTAYEARRAYGMARYARRPTRRRCCVAAVPGRWLFLSLRVPIVDDPYAVCWFAARMRASDVHERILSGVRFRRERGGARASGEREIDAAVSACAALCCCCGRFCGIRYGEGFARYVWWVRRR